VSASVEPSHLRGIVITVAAVLCLVPDATLVRLADAADARIIFWRTVFAAVSLTAVVALRHRRGTVRAVRAIGRPGLAVAVLWGSVSILFVYAVNHTAVANALVIVATAPLFAALFTWVLIGEPIHRRVWFAVLVALTGVVITFASALRAGGLDGSVAALTLAAVVGASLTTIRRSGLEGTDMLPALALAGVIAAAVALPFAWPPRISTHDVVVIGALGLVLLPAAQTLVTKGTRYLSSPEVGLLMLIETVLAPLLVWVVVGESPPPLAAVGAVIVIGAIAGNSLAALRQA
jgi:drug/metabolite transporter (DMT)-like permease